MNPSADQWTHLTSFCSVAFFEYGDYPQIQIPTTVPCK